MSLDTPGVPVATASLGSRKGTTKPHDPNRFYCPFPGCKRSFAELWRLKVHYRAPPDVRGSGKERGHGAELAGCPKCGVDLKPGKHHVGCFGGRTTTRQARRRISKDEEGSRKRARTGEALVPSLQPLAPMYPQVPLQVQRNQLQPNSLAWEPREAAIPPPMPVGPFLMNFSQFSHPLPEAVVFTPSVTQNPFTLDEIDQYSPFVFGNAGETPIMATANLACDVNTCIPGQYLPNCSYQETIATPPAPKPDPVWFKDDLQMGLVEIDKGLFNAGDCTNFFNDPGSGMAPLSRNSKDYEVCDPVNIGGLTLQPGISKKPVMDRFCRPDVDLELLPGLMPVGLDHQAPQDASEFTARSDILLTAPGIMEPVAFASKGRNDKRGAVKGP